jgi:hypothetical protein
LRIKEHETRLTLHEHDDDDDDDDVLLRDKKYCQPEVFEFCNGSQSVISQSLE